MSVFRRKNSRYWWISVYRGPGVSRMQVSSGSEDRAEAEAIERVMAMGRGRASSRDRLVAALDNLVHERNEGLPFDTAYQICLTDGGSREYHVRSAVEALKTWLAGRHPRCQSVQELSRAIAYEYADELRERLSAKSWNNVRGYLAAVWKAAGRRLGLSGNVWADVPTSSTHDSQHGRPFTDTEIAGIHEGVVPEEWYAVCVLAAAT